MSAPITIRGRLGKDPEMKFAASGTGIAKLSVVSSQSVKTPEGNWEDRDTTWWNVTAFKVLAEQITEQLVKGDAVIVIGRVKSREWEDPKTGEKRQAMEVLADAVGRDLSKPRKGEAVNRPVPAADDPWTQQNAEAPF